MDLYMQTDPKTTFWTQLSGIIIRRYLVFIREPRQWFMIIAPFVNVLSFIVMIEVVVLAISGESSAETKKIVKALVAWLFPFFLLMGFCLSSGIYMIISLTDKNTKMRQYMYLSGVGPLAYYLGLFIADFTLYCITEIIFSLFVVILGLSVYSEQMFAFLSLLTTFGLVLIPFTYLFQHMFKNPDSAFRLIGVFYVLLGVVVPSFFVLIFFLALGASDFGYYFG